MSGAALRSVPPLTSELDELRDRASDALEARNRTRADADAATAARERAEDDPAISSAEFRDILRAEKIALRGAADAAATYGALANAVSARARADEAPALIARRQAMADTTATARTRFFDSITGAEAALAALFTAVEAEQRADDEEARSSAIAVPWRPPSFIADRLRKEIDAAVAARQHANARATFAIVLQVLPC